MNRLKIVVTPIVIADREHEVMNVVHETSLKYILQELVIHHGSPRFDLQDDGAVSAQSVGIERFVDVIVQAELYRDGYFHSLGLARFDAIADLFKMRPEVAQNSVAIQAVIG